MSSIQLNGNPIKSVQIGNAFRSRKLHGRFMQMGLTGYANLLLHEKRLGQLRNIIGFSCLQSFPAFIRSAELDSNRNWNWILKLMRRRAVSNQKIKKFNFGFNGRTNSKLSENSNGIETNWLKFQLFVIATLPIIAKLLRLLICIVLIMCCTSTWYANESCKWAAAVMHFLCVFSLSNFSFSTWNIQVSSFWTSSIYSS